MHLRCPQHLFSTSRGIILHTPHLHQDCKELPAGEEPGSGLAAAVAVGVGSVAIEDGAKFVDSVSPPSTMEDKSPWNSYGKPCFHILNLSNNQM